MVPINFLTLIITGWSCGDMIKHFCCVPMFLDMTGDFVWQNCCCLEECVDKNKGLGTSIVLLVLLLAHALFGKHLLSFFLSKAFGGEILKLILERARWGGGVSETGLICFSFLLLALSCVFSRSTFWFDRWDSGVFGSLVGAVYCSIRKHLIITNFLK